MEKEWPGPWSDMFTAIKVEPPITNQGHKTDRA